MSVIHRSEDSISPYLIIRVDFPTWGHFQLNSPPDLGTNTFDLIRITMQKKKHTLLVFISDYIILGLPFNCVFMSVEKRTTNFKVHGLIGTNKK